MTLARQYALPFPQEAEYRPNAFLRGAANEEATLWADDPGRWPGGRLAVHGEAGTGKTHFLHWFAARHDGTFMPAQALRVLPALPPGDGPLALDDADMAPNDEALLHALNAAADARRPVLLAGEGPPSAWRFRLADLTSRLRAITAVAIRPPEDDLLRALLAQALSARQLAVPERLQAWLLERLPRTGAAMRDAAARLDRLSLASGGAVTREILHRAVLDGEESVPPFPTVLEKPPALF